MVNSDQHCCSSQLLDSTQSQDISIEKKGFDVSPGLAGEIPYLLNLLLQAFP
jgi:hypothetical protein